MSIKDLAREIVLQQFDALLQQCGGEWAWGPCQAGMVLGSVSNCAGMSRVDLTMFPFTCYAVHLCNTNDYYTLPSLVPTNKE